MSWEQKCLDELGTISRGKSKHRPRNDPSLFDGKYPFIQTADVKNANFYITEYSQTYNEKGLAQSKIWKKGTLCITIAANIADTGILGIDACFPDSIMGFVPYEDKSDVRYVKYCFDILQKQCQQISQGATQDNLSWEKLSTIKFPAPPLEIQKRIADILSAYDDLIENNQKQIKLLEEAAQRLYKEWFVDLRFPGYENTPVVDDVPLGWRNGILDDIVVESGKNEKKEKRENYSYYLPIDCLPKQSIGYTETADICLAESSLVAFSKSDIIFGAMRPYFHKVVVARDRGLTRSTCFVLNARESEFWAYAAMLMFSKDTVDYATQISVGTTMPYARWKDLKQMPIIIPTLSIADTFQKSIRPIIDKIGVLSKAIMALREARDCLLPKLMNGELEV